MKAFAFVALARVRVKKTNAVQIGHLLSKKSTQSVQKLEITTTAAASPARQQWILKSK